MVVGQHAAGRQHRVVDRRLVDGAGEESAPERRAAVAQLHLDCLRQARAAEGEGQSRRPVDVDDRAVGDAVGR